jgi:polysaccharide pyruvyl transferase WcaK-like protein
MKNLIVEFNGTSTRNRGAELMAMAIMQRLRATFPGVTMVASPNFGAFEARARHELYTTWEFPGRIRTKGYLRFAPPAVKRSMGLIAPEKVDVVLDASGFAFSDQCGGGAANWLLRRMPSRARRHQPLILLPQAFGPFDEPGLHATWQRLFDRAHVMFARDSLSLMAAKEFCNDGRLKLCPDFTSFVSPAKVEDIEVPETFSAVVPNMRMLDKTEHRDSYLEFLRHAVMRLSQLGLNPIYVLHDADEDRKVCELVRMAGIEIPVIEHSDPTVLKGVIGRARLVVGSRFHALVNALSLGVPCIGTGWSHKYSELFSDFACPEFLCRDVKDLGKLDALLAVLTKESRHKELCNTLARRAEVQMCQIAAMWTEVESIIESVQQCADHKTVSPLRSAA